MYLRFNSGMEDLMKYNKNASNSLFSERSAKNKVLIIVPHEDDETIIAGNIIDLLKLSEFITAENAGFLIISLLIIFQILRLLKILLNLSVYFLSL